MLTYTGFLKVKMAERQVSERFKTREFVITDNSPSYPQTIVFQLTQERCSLLDKLKVGDEVKVHFNLRGREWKSPQGEIKFFNSLDVFKVEKITKQNQAAVVREEEEPSFSNETVVPTPDDDLPF